MTRPSHYRSLPGGSPIAPERGFTAAELSAVAAIIAILALIIVPIFRDRVDETKRIATLDDMQGMAKALMLVKADTGRFVRLQDLDNPDAIVNDPPNSSQEVPIGTYTKPFTDPDERTFFATNWDGPYAAFQRHITLAELLATNFAIQNGGPALIFDATTPGAPAGPPLYTDFSGDRYPIDPYGTPYIFHVGRSDYPVGGWASYGIAGETPFGNCALFSLGPNQLPGDGTNLGGLGSLNATANPLWRESAVVGTGDDLSYIF